LNSFVLSLVNGEVNRKVFMPSLIIETEANASHDRVKTFCAVRPAAPEGPSIKGRCYTRGFAELWFMPHSARRSAVRYPNPHQRSRTAPPIPEIEPPQQHAHATIAPR